MKTFFKFLVPALAFPAAALAFEKSFKGLVNWFVSLVGMAVPVIFSFSVLAVSWGIFKYIFLSGGDEKEIEKSRNVMFYGIIGLFIMVSVWGLVRVITNSLDGTPDVINQPADDGLPVFPEA